MILPLSNTQKKKLEIFRRFLVKKIINKYPNFSGDLSLLHKYIEKKNINKVRLSLFNEINKKFKWEDLITSLCGHEIEKIHGRDLVIQSKINLSIQIPYDETSVLPLHTDCNSADSPFQTNIWIPLTNAYSTNSMIILGKRKSLNYFKKISDNKKEIGSIKNKPSDFVKINYGNLLLFNPAMLHGNVINKTRKTRVSLNVRVKSPFSPEPDNRNPDRRLGTYYKTWKLSDDTKFAIQLIKTGFFK